MSDELAAALIGAAGVVTGILARYLYDFFKERREGGEKAAGKAIEILTGRFNRADDPAERDAIERLLREIGNDYLPYLQKKMARIIKASRDVVGDLAPTGAIAPDMPDLSPSDREALGRAAATIAALDPPKTVEDLFLQGNAFYAAGQFDKALSQFNMALELAPDNPTNLTNRGAALAKLERRDEALADYNRSLELRPDDPDTFNNRGVTFRHLQRYGEALADYNRSLKLRPDHPGTLSNRAKALYYLRRYEEALPDFNRSLELRPNHPDTLYDRGTNLGHLQRYEEALADYDRALELAPDNLDALYNRACTFSLMGRLREALEQLDEAISRDEKYRKIAREDEEFDNVRSDPTLGPEIERLVAEP